jgi:hypothetical protein
MHVSEAQWHNVPKSYPLSSCGNYMGLSTVATRNEWWLINFMSDIHGSTVFNYAQLIIINSTKPRKYVIRPILSHLCPEAFVL